MSLLKLVYRSLDGDKVEVPLRPGEVVTVGRSPGSTIRVRNPSVSRSHAEVMEGGGGWIVKDLGSSNHTFVNDQQVETARISEGDELRFGDFPVKVQPWEGDGSSRASREPERPSRAGADADGESSREDRLRQLREERAREREERLRRARGEEPARAEPPPEPVRDLPRKTRLKDPQEEAPARAPAVDPEELRELRSAGRANERLGAELAEAQARVDEMDRRIRELEAREQRQDEELDGWHERYNRIREQLEHKDSLLERAREELQERVDEADGLQKQVASLEAQVTQFESSRSEVGDQLGELKAKVVQKDRRIDELQRELDLMEYDLRSTREELEGLQDSFNHDNSEQRRLERESALLREVIAEKENVISELKLEIEEKSREIYDLKLGTGMKDLEEARRDVLEQFFAKNREADELAEKLKGADREMDTLRGQLEEMEARLNEQRDITTHPDFQRKQRELERAQADLEESRGDAERLGRRLEEFGPDAKGKLDAEINFLQRKNKALQDKLEATQDELEEAREALVAARAAGGAAAAAPASADSTGEIDASKVVRAKAFDQVEQALETYAVWKSNLNLLRTYIEEVEETVAEGGDVAEALKSVDELLTLVLSDASSLRGELTGLKDVLGEG